MKKIVFLFLIFISGCSTINMSSGVNKTLSQMNDAYKNKEIDNFMVHISPDYNGNKDALKTAVKNDFAGFAKVEYETTVQNVQFDKIEKIYTADVSFLRMAMTDRYALDKKLGVVTLKFKKTDDGIQLLEMPNPALYGLITP